MAEDEKSEKMSINFSEADPETLQRTINVEFIFEDTEISYADQYIVQPFPEEFIISFFQTEHPIVFTKDAFQKLEKLSAYCIFRIVLRPNQIKEFSEILQKQIKLWEDRYKKPTEIE